MIHTHAKGNTVLDVAGLILANVLAWVWDKILPHITQLPDVDFAAWHDLLACVFTSISITYLLYKFRREIKRNNKE